MTKNVGLLQNSFRVQRARFFIPTEADWPSHPPPPGDRLSPGDLAKNRRLRRVGPKIVSVCTENEFFSSVVAEERWGFSLRRS